MKSSCGLEAWLEYDVKGNLIYEVDSDGEETWYDSEGNEIQNPNINEAS